MLLSRCGHCSHVLAALGVFRVLAALWCSRRQRESTHREKTIGRGRAKGPYNKQVGGAFVIGNKTHTAFIYRLRPCISTLLRINTKRTAQPIYMMFISHVCLRVGPDAWRVVGMKCGLVVGKKQENESFSSLGLYAICGPLIGQSVCGSACLRGVRMF